MATQHRERDSYILAISHIVIPTFLGQNPKKMFPDSFTAEGQASGLDSSNDVGPCETQTLI